MEDRNAPEYQDTPENKVYYDGLKKRMLRHGDIRLIQINTGYSRTTIWKVLNDKRDDVDDITALEILKEAERIGKQNKLISSKVKGYYGREDN
jgi:hypothetical protein